MVFFVLGYQHLFFMGIIVEFILSTVEGSLTCNAYHWATFIEAKKNLYFFSVILCFCGNFPKDGNYQNHLALQKTKFVHCKAAGLKAGINSGK